MVELLDDNSKGNFEAVVLIELGRIYDMLSVIANALDPAKFNAMTIMHEQGQIVGPPPAIKINEP